MRWSRSAWSGGLEECLLLRLALDFCLERRAGVPERAIVAVPAGLAREVVFVEGRFDALDDIPDFLELLPVASPLLEADADFAGLLVRDVARAEQADDELDRDGAVEHVVDAELVHHFSEERTRLDGVGRADVVTLRLVERDPLLVLELLADDEAQEVQEALLVRRHVTGSLLVDDLDDAALAVSREAHEVGLCHQAPLRNIIEPLELTLGANLAAAFGGANLVRVGHAALDTLKRLGNLLGIELFERGVDNDLTLFDVSGGGSEFDGFADNPGDLLGGCHITGLLRYGLAKLVPATQEQFHLLVRKLAHSHGVLLFRVQNGEQRSQAPLTGMCFPSYVPMDLT